MPSTVNIPQYVCRLRDGRIGGYSPINNTLILAGKKVDDSSSDVENVEILCGQGYYWAELEDKLPENLVAREADGHQFVVLLFYGYWMKEWSLPKLISQGWSLISQEMDNNTYDKKPIKKLVLVGTTIESCGLNSIYIYARLQAGNKYFFSF